jgi:hypothetical protein
MQFGMKEKTVRKAYNFAAYNDILCCTMYMVFYPTEIERNLETT